MSKFDTQGINHATVAISMEMAPSGRQRFENSDTLFLGGASLSDADRGDLARFGLNKNYQIIFASYDMAAPERGAVDVGAVVSDGKSEAHTLRGGRLWKRDRRSPAVLLFPEIGALIKMSAKGRLVVRPMTGSYREEGFQMARAAISHRAERRPGRAPVLTSIGGVTTIMDVRALAVGLAAG